MYYYFLFLYIDANVENAEPREKDLEAIADVLNDFQFAVPDVPRRISTRVKKAPIRYSDEQVEEKIHDFSAMTNMCKHSHHAGFGCAAASADHFPEYFNSLDNVGFKSFFVISCYSFIYNYLSLLYVHLKLVVASSFPTKLIQCCVVPPAKFAYLTMLIRLNNDIQPMNY